MNESIIILRDQNMKINAFYNLCRHRGSKLLKKKYGNISKSIVCPYHQWVYNKEGKLIYCPDIGPTEKVDLSEYNLIPCKFQEMKGLIFVHFYDNIIDFGECRSHVENHLKFQGLSDGKIAFEKDYILDANWKIIYENNRECYHCKGHPEYINANYDTLYSYNLNPDGTRTRDLNPNVSDSKRKEYLDEKENSVKRWKEMGLDEIDTSQTSFPGSGWYKVSRVVMRKDWCSESVDGNPVSLKIMGNPPKTPSNWGSSLHIQKENWDMGSLRIHTFPNFWIHTVADYSVSVHFVPISPSKTKVTCYWIVHKDAVEGMDYDLSKLLHYWQKTAEQDWEICENNQKGIMSSKYEPGPLMMNKESGVDYFLEWYLKNLN